MRQHLLHWWSYVTDSLSDRNWILAISHVCQFSNRPSHWNIFLVTLVSLVVSLNTLVTPVSFVIPVRVVTMYTICTLRNFQFYLAHLWMGFQSCWPPFKNHKISLNIIYQAQGGKKISWRAIIFTGGSNNHTLQPNWSRVISQNIYFTTEICIELMPKGKSGGITWQVRDDSRIFAGVASSLPEFPWQERIYHAIAFGKVPLCDLLPASQGQRQPQPLTQ